VPSDRFEQEEKQLPDRSIARFGVDPTEARECVANKEVDPES
jgi:hypothetical protein